MSRMYFLTVLALALVGVSTVETALAQQPRVWGSDPVLDRPAVSPYLQLNNRAQAGSVPYYTYVRPILEQQSSLQRQQRQLQQLQTQVNQNRGPGGPQTISVTGHHTTFGNLSHFYGGSPMAGMPPTSMRR